MKTSHSDIFDIEQIWKEFFQTRSESCRNAIMLHYLKHVKYTAERIWVKLPDKVDLDDLIQAGIFGLMDAIDAFDPERRIKFETYCAPRIRGSILDELRSMDWVPRLVRSRAQRLERAQATLEAQLGRPPTEQELTNEMKLNKVEFQEFQREASAFELISLNNFTENDGDKEIDKIDLLEDHRSQNPVLEAQKQDLKNLLSKGFTRAEKLILILYYYEEMPMKEIGTTLDLSESRVSQMHSSILNRLKNKMGSRKKDFLVNS
jgi:RNA polymerase sigma factor for flagellar operon FliA